MYEVDPARLASASSSSGSFALPPPLQSSNSLTQMTTTSSSSSGNVSSSSSSPSVSSKFAGFSFPSRSQSNAQCKSFLFFLFLLISPHTFFTIFFFFSTATIFIDQGKGWIARPSRRKSSSGKHWCHCVNHISSSSSNNSGESYVFDIGADRPGG